MSAQSTPESQRARAWVDVRKGPWWPGARLPVEMSLRDGALVLRVTTIRLAEKERRALTRLAGDEVLSTLIAKREEPEIALPLNQTRFRYPRVFGLGRTHIRVRAPGRPDAVLLFTDPGDVGDPMANPYGLMAGMLRHGPASRVRRDAWRDAIEAAAAPYRSSTVSS